VVRKRPMNRREVQSQSPDVLLCRDSAVIVREPKLKVDLTKYVEEHNFLFDESFDETVSNEQLYRACVQPIIDAVFQRAKCTCFAYGQTGSGKTFTMMGPPKRLVEGLPLEERTPGIFLLASQDIFRLISSKEYAHLGVFIAFYEIYCGKLFDLLNNRQLLHARENAKQNVVIVGLQEHPVGNVQDLMEVIEFGLNSRTTGVTGANVDSSRSHAILQISLKDLESKEEHGKISFIDLAGSERGADTLDTDRQTRMDGAEINKSLLALKECIRALDQQLDHTPFRGSKLTQVLKDSLIDPESRTVMIANVSPCSISVEHSLNTLRYAYRVKELRSGSTKQSGGPAPSPGIGDPGMQYDQGPPQAYAQGDLADDVSSDESLLVDEDGVRDYQPQQSAPFHNSFSAPSAGPLDGIPASSSYASAYPGGGSSSPAEWSGNAAAAQQMGRSALGSAPAAAASAAGGMPLPQQHHQMQHMQQPQRLQHLQQQQHDAMMRPDNAPPPLGDLGLGGAEASQAALDELARQHDRLIGTILAEEEELITSHRQHIDMMVELIKEEMVHLNNVDRPGSDVDAYVTGLDRILGLKAEYIGEIRGRVDMFKEHLQQEDSLSRKFQSLASSSS